MGEERIIDFLKSRRSSCPLLVVCDCKIELTQSIRDGLYHLDSKYILVKNPAESCGAIGIDTTSMMPKNRISVLDRTMAI